MSTLLFLLSFLMQKPNYCSCTPLGPIDDKQYNEYNLIARGKVAKVTMTDFERTIYLTVDTYYKNGGKQTQIKIITPKEESECGIIPKVGENWLVFAYTNGHDYRTELCTRTKNMNSKAWDYNKDEIVDDIKFLETKATNNSH